MQGNEAENSIIGALEQIFDREDEFDVVVLIRGGGSQSDLNCFNSYRLTCSLAQFPLPILTGIGHDRDETIADRVAFVALKTPTAVAEYLINKAFLFDNRLQELTQQLAETMESAVQLPERYLQEQSRRLHNILQSFLHRQDKSIQTYRFRLAHAGAALLLQHRNEQDRRLVSLRSSVRNMLQTQKARLPDLAHKLNLLDPKKLLDRGYSITLSGGKVVRGIKGLKDGQKLETVFQDGRAESVVVGKWRPLF
jgi:exodeoxyribonuclease VII large subunit